MNNEQLEELCKRLESNDRGLLSVVLEYADLGKSGAERLGKALAQNNVISFVSLRFCNLGYEGMKVIFESLKGRGVKTRIKIDDDCSEDEEIKLRQMIHAPASQDKEKQKGNKKNTSKKKYKKNQNESFGNQKGIDDDIFAKYANNGHGVEEDKFLTPEKQRVHQ